MPPRCIDFMFCKSTCSGLIGILVQAQVMILWGFLDALTKFLSAVRVWIGSIVGSLIFKISISQIGQFGPPPPPVSTKMGGRNQVISELNGVVVARDGLILRENEATGSRKVSRYLPGLWDVFLRPQNKNKTGHLTKTFEFSVF